MYPSSLQVKSTQQLSLIKPNQYFCRLLMTIYSHVKLLSLLFISLLCQHS